MRALLCADLLASAPTLSSAERRTMERTTFIEKKSKAELAGERVAVAFRYLCPRGRADKVHARPQKKLEARCDGPFGETYLAGTLAGKPASAVYTVEKAAPCCVWRSYPADDGTLRGKRLHWLKTDVPTVEIGSAWLTIGPDNPHWPPDTGPLAGGAYVPMLRRK